MMVYRSNDKPKYKCAEPPWTLHWSVNIKVTKKANKNQLASNTVKHTKINACMHQAPRECTLVDILYYHVASATNTSHH